MLSKKFCVITTLISSLACFETADGAPLASPFGSLKIGNVCVMMTDNRRYNVVPTLDYFMIEIYQSGSEKLSHRVYVGYNPDIGDENRGLMSRKLYKLPEVKRVMQLSGAQSGQILGIPKAEHEYYFHVIPDETIQGKSSQINHTANATDVRFC